MQAKGSDKVGFARLMMETQDRIRDLTGADKITPPDVNYTIRWQNPVEVSAPWENKHETAASLLKQYEEATDEKIKLDLKTRLAENWVFLLLVWKCEDLTRRRKRNKMRNKKLLSDADRAEIENLLTKYITLRKEGNTVEAYKVLTKMMIISRSIVDEDDDENGA